jgi:hypothetical protein
MMGIINVPIMHHTPQSNDLRTHKLERLGKTGYESQTWKKVGSWDPEEHLL